MLSAIAQRHREMAAYCDLCGTSDGYLHRLPSTGQGRIRGHRPGRKIAQLRSADERKILPGSLSILSCFAPLGIDDANSGSLTVEELSLTGHHDYDVKNETTMMSDNAGRGKGMTL